MSKINMSGIMSKVSQYAKTDDGKKKISEKINEYIDNGVNRTDGGGVVITKETMCKAAEEMIRILKSTASSSGIPASVLAHFDSLTYSPPRQSGKKEYTIDIYFADDLSRLSLKIASGKRRGERTGDGIDNIVSLFDTGYPLNKKASKRVSGIWEGHEELGEIWSRTSREGTRFMSNSIEQFNITYGDKYNVTAYIDGGEKFYFYNE